jgi:hypothetical protein
MTCRHGHKCSSGKRGSLGKLCAAFLTIYAKPDQLASRWKRKEEYLKDPHA